jgi:hypothetical protein
MDSFSIFNFFGFLVNWGEIIMGKVVVIIENSQKYFLK